ncbi:RAB family [Caenorhabditis elegans]|uniref:RAB family n=1 Tax=Caenorhabditis elegans TaxID=6239 RepID=A0A0K3ASU7_CAEEL|nr:RAB family [Caenorhabditis elegans]CTQ87093.1 RAB family [Caenorhabditis elegans]|eukprot:NP_001300382.1 RAB family [Caenorhabditis elegans]
MHPVRKRSSIYQDVDLTYTVMLLGDSCTGKTCLLIRYKDGAFLNNNFISTVGIDYRNKLITMGDKKVKLQIWDTAGQERFRSVTTSYYRDADALLLVYDIANRASFENCRNWLSQIKEYGKEAVQVTLVGNKCDLPRAVPTDEGKRLAEAYQIPFMETSAKTGFNVDRAFLGLAERMLKLKYGFVPGGEMADTISVADTKKPEIARCCTFN